MAYVVAVDIGGTFTDLVAFDHDTQKVAYTKSPTTYGNFVDGILDCFEQGEDRTGRRALLQSRHDARHQRADPAPRREGRAGHDRGLSRRARDRARQPARSLRPALSARRAAHSARAALRGRGAHRRQGRGHRFRSTSPRSNNWPIELNAARDRGRRRSSSCTPTSNPTHERRAAELLRACCPGVFVTSSTELTREWYEYERTFDRRRQRLCRARGHDLHPPARQRPQRRAASTGRSS